MARFCIAFETMKNFVGIRGDETLEEMVRQSLKALACLNRALHYSGFFFPKFYPFSIF